MSAVFVQPPLFDPQEGARLRDEGIERAGGAAPVLAVADALWAVCYVARHRATFTTDHVWAVLEAIDAPSFPEPRALGAVMRDAQREGWIAATDDYDLSKRKVCHRRPLRIWRSLRYQGAGRETAA